MSEEDEYRPYYRKRSAHRRKPLPGLVCVGDSGVLKFPDVASCAEHFGTSKATIYKVMRLGIEFRGYTIDREIPVPRKMINSRV